MQKIAIPSEGNRFAQHFGRCPEYTIIETDGKEILNKKVIPNPGHEPGFLPRYLKDLGVDCVLAGGMGRRAKDLFDSNGIKVVTGVSGSIEDGVKLYLEGKLETEEDICDH
ncbi:MAG: hypothetical protein PWR10_120 [Halanaerobiales bacterium]|nr:hypothetical protein [Halanaerobiales bacterium]